MKRHQIPYFFAEGMRSIFLHGFMSFATIGVIIACLIIMGSFTLLTVNVQAIITDLEQRNELTVYIKDELSDADARSIGTKISAIDNVRKSDFVSREEKFESWKSNFESDIMSGLSNDILPHRYYVYLVDIAQAKDTIGRISAIAGVDEVLGSEEIMSTLLSIRNTVQIISAALIIALTMVSVFIMSNTVKLTTFDRREEIGIMRIVGATKAFIRGPFVVEGFLLGSMAGLTAYFLQWFAYTQLETVLLSEFQGIGFVPFGELMFPLLLVFAGAGFLVGVGGSVLTIRKFLRM